MSFNSHAYYRNKWRAEAIEELAVARDIKANGHPWRSIESAVRMARCNWRLYLSSRTLRELQGRRNSRPYAPPPWTTRKEANAPKS